MTQLQWKDKLDSADLERPTDFQNSKKNPWFTVSMVLLGIIAGFLFGTFSNVF